MLVLSLLKFYILIIINSDQYLYSFIIKISSILKAGKLKQEIKMLWVSVRT